MFCEEFELEADAGLLVEAADCFPITLKRNVWWASWHLVGKVIP